MRYFNFYSVIAMLLCCISMAGVFQEKLVVVIGAGLAAVAWATLAVAHSGKKR